MRQRHEPTKNTQILKAAVNETVKEATILAVVGQPNGPPPAAILHPSRSTRRAVPPWSLTVVEVYTRSPACPQRLVRIRTPARVQVSTRISSLAPVVLARPVGHIQTRQRRIRLGSQKQPMRAKNLSNADVPVKLHAVVPPAPHR